MGQPVYSDSNAMALAVAASWSRSGKNRWRQEDEESIQALFPDFKERGRTDLDVLFEQASSLSVGPSALIRPITTNDQCAGIQLLDLLRTR